MGRLAPDDPRGRVPGYPQNMGGGMAMGMNMNMSVAEDDTRRLAQRETRGMRHDWSHVRGLTTVVRVLPPELYERVMLGTEPLPAGSSIFGPVPSRRKMS